MHRHLFVRAGKAVAAVSAALLALWGAACQAQASAPAAELAKAANAQSATIYLTHPLTAYRSALTEDQLLATAPRYFVCDAANVRALYRNVATALAPPGAEAPARFETRNGVYFHTDGDVTARLLFDKDFPSLPAIAASVNGVPAAVARGLPADLASWVRQHARVGQPCTPPGSCVPNALRTSRTLVLARDGAPWGGAQHAPLPTLQPGEVVLTFDDGPSPLLTPLVLEALAAQCVHATFFLTGSALKLQPDVARRLVEAGHSVAMHGYNHEHFGNLTEAQQLADLRAMQQVFQRAFGQPAPAYRFPFLEQTPTLMAALKADKASVMSIDLAIEDWLPDQTTATLVARMLERLAKTKGGIILMHDPQPATALALPTLLKALQHNGYRVVHLRWE